MKSDYSKESITEFLSRKYGEDIRLFPIKEGYYVKSVVVGFVRLFTLRLSPEEVAGPIGIVQVVGDTVETGMSYSIWSVVKSLLTLSALLSVNLGVINLFPIPAMDGGRLVFLFIEGLRDKPFDREKYTILYAIIHRNYTILYTYPAVLNRPLRHQ